jgi:hypothetical protein
LGREHSAVPVYGVVYAVQYKIVKIGHDGLGAQALQQFDQMVVTVGDDI